MNKALRKQPCKAIYKYNNKKKLSTNYFKELKILMPFRQP